MRPISAGPVRRGLHAAHAVTSLALLLTGLLILWPELRSRTLGGYGRELGEAHVALGLAFAIAPLLAWLLVPRGLLGELWQRIPLPGPEASARATLHARWRRTHVVLTLFASAALTISGLVLWLGVDLPVALWDGTDQVHVVCHWVVMSSVPLHLLVACKKIAERIRLMLGGEPPDLFEFADDADPKADEPQ